MLTMAVACLALTIYHESRSEPLAGQQAVALVAWNRANHDKTRLCEVTFAEKQFSWTNKLVKRTKTGFQLRPGGIPKETDAWKSAVFTARLVSDGKLPDFTKGATFYHTKAVRPYWSRDLKLVVAIGQHLFYRYA